MELNENPTPPRIRIYWKQLANGEVRFEMTFEATGISDFPVVKMDLEIAEAMKRADEILVELLKRAARPPSELFEMLSASVEALKNEAEERA